MLDFLEIIGCPSIPTRVLVEYSMEKLHYILLFILAATMLCGQLAYRTHLTLPMVAPPLPDDGLSRNGADLVVVHTLARDRHIWAAEEHDERELRQVDFVDLLEEPLPQARIRCRLFLRK